MAELAQALEELHRRTRRCDGGDLLIDGDEGFTQAGIAPMDFAQGIDVLGRHLTVSPRGEDAGEGLEQMAAAEESAPRTGGVVASAFQPGHGVARAIDLPL